MAILSYPLFIFFVFNTPVVDSAFSRENTACLSKDYSTPPSKALLAYIDIGVRAGRAGGGGGGLQPPQILVNSDFLGSTRNLGNASF